MFRAYVLPDLRACLHSDESSDVKTVDDCFGNSTDGSGDERQWTNAVQNFDTVGDALLTLYEFSTLENWYETFSNINNAPSALGDAPGTGNHLFLGPCIFSFLLIVIGKICSMCGPPWRICAHTLRADVLCVLSMCERVNVAMAGNFLLINAYVGLTYQRFVSIKNNQGRSGIAMTPAQLAFVESVRLLSQSTPKKVLVAEPSSPSSSFLSRSASCVLRTDWCVALWLCGSGT